MVYRGKFTRQHFIFRSFLLISILILSFPVTSCNMPRPQTLTAASAGDQAVTPVLREFYADLKGERYLGKPISDKFLRDGSTCQYTSNALMCMNPIETDPVRRFYLVSLGKDLGVYEPADFSIGTDSSTVIDGYHIFPAFVAVYNDLGAAVVGPPLTNIRQNTELGQMEQYFGNLGFYLRLDDPDARVELLPYGEYLCPDYQGAKRPQPPLASPRVTIQPAAILNRSMDRLGGTDIFGSTISQAYTAPDGALEQVYETVAIFAPQARPDLIRFRPLPVLLGMYQEAPKFPEHDNHQSMIFYPTSGELGYHVPILFDEFIELHGGREFSGQPLSDPVWDVQNGTDIVRQCFTNYCLDYNPQAPVNDQVHLAPLGMLYLQRGSLSPQGHAPLNQSLQLVVSEMLPQLPSTAYQTLTIMAFRNADGRPIPNLEAVATLTTANGGQHIFRSAPTGEDGSTTMVIPPLPDTRHGEMITYQICLNTTDTVPVCQSESYLLWDLN